MQSVSTRHVPTGTLADQLYGRANNADLITGRAPFGYHEDTTVQAPAQKQAKMVEVKGAASLFTPKGALFWVIAGAAVFLILNEKARR